MVRLCFDQEARSRGITTMPLPEDVRRDIEHVLRARLADLVRAGSGVVLGFSFWSRRMRDEYREFLKPFGVVPETVYLATDRAAVLPRIAARAARSGDDFKISTELADPGAGSVAAEGALLRGDAGEAGRRQRCRVQVHGVDRRQQRGELAGPAPEPSAG